MAGFCTTDCQAFAYLILDACAPTRTLTPSLPLITISIVRTISFTIYTSTKRILNSTQDTPYPPGQKPWLDLHLGVLNKNRTADVALTSLIAGGASGAVVCLGSAPFELVKVRRRAAIVTNT